MRAVLPQDTLFFHETSVELIKVLLSVFYFYGRSIYVSVKKILKQVIG